MTEPESVTMSPDMVNHPPHYNQGGIECYKAIREAVKNTNGWEGFCTGNAMKYLWRWKHKGGKEDLKKAKWYIEKLLEEEEP